MLFSYSRSRVKQIVSAAHSLLSVGFDVPFLRIDFPQYEIAFKLFAIPFWGIDFPLIPFLGILTYLLQIGATYAKPATRSIPSVIASPRVTTRKLATGLQTGHYPAMGDTMGARKLFDSGSKWTDITARAAMPIVLRRAIDGEPITYGDLDKALVSRGELSVMAIAYRYVAGKIGDICEELSRDLAESVPPLNAIIVNQGSGLPSHGVDGYLARYLGKKPNYIKKLSDEHRNAYAAQAMETVLAYNGWDNVRKHLGISLEDLDLNDPDRGDPIPPPNPKRFATGPESEAHKALKAWVADNPSVFASYGKFKKGGTEKSLSSGDRLDVLFDNGNEMLAVEVKALSASDDEVQRGVYQCIKYRATIRAMQLAAAKPPTGNAVLVTERKPPAIVVSLAKRLSVNVLSVSANR